MRAEQASQVQVPRFTAQDEADLEWFFCLGQSAFAKSTMGGMLAAAENLSVTSTGVRVLSVRQQSNNAWNWRQRNTWKGRRCGFIDEAAADIIRRAVAPFVDELDPAPSAMCRQHQGQSNLWIPPRELLERHGRVSRRLCRAMLAHYQALETYYRPEAYRWETYQLTRLIVLYPLTEAGRRLLDNRERRLGVNDDVFRPENRLRSEYEHYLSSKHRDDLTRHLLGLAGRQALDLLGFARLDYAGAPQ